MRAQFSEYQLYLRCDFCKEYSSANGKMCLFGDMHAVHRFKRFLLMALACLVASLAWAQPTVLNIEQLGQLTPQKLEGYRSSEPKGRMLKIGTLSYSMIERTFVHGKKQINIMLFDYHNASVMYRQATQKWKGAEGLDSDARLECAYDLQGQPGWMSFDKINNKSQLALGVQNRFYLVLIGEGMPLDVLEAIAKSFELSRFPLPEVAITDAKYR